MIIRLFCAAGISTSILVKKMRDAARDTGREAEIMSYPVIELEKMADGADVILLGPQVGFHQKRAREYCEPKGIAVGVISSEDYGHGNGLNVLEYAFELKEKMQQG